MGMIYACYPAETFVQEVSNLANKLAQMPTKGLGLTKRALNASMHASLTEQLKTEELLQLQAANTFDNKEGINAFLEKRKANFIGK
jgi:2-(1,2-epoxy-1,2-dihydrophenyl)acetyl-CoA isomerase